MHIHATNLSEIELSILSTLETAYGTKLGLKNLKNAEVSKLMWPLLYLGE